MPKNYIVKCSSTSGAHRLDVVGCFWDGRGEDVRAIGGNEHVVLDADAPDARERGEARAIEAARGLLGERGIVQDRGHDVEAGLDGDGHAGREVAVEAQVAQTELRGALTSGGIPGAIAQI